MARIFDPLDPDDLFLSPGDILCYYSPGIVAWWIRWKTWSDVNHVEMYVGDEPWVAQNWWLRETQEGRTLTDRRRAFTARQQRSPFPNLHLRTTVAARGSTGIDFYPLRREGLRLVLRPQVPFNLGDALYWFNQEALGYGYDTIGVVASFYARWRGAQNKEQFCSELVARLCRAGGWDLVNPDYDADAVAPDTCTASPTVRWIGASR